MAATMNGEAKKSKECLASNRVLSEISTETVCEKEKLRSVGGEKSTGSTFQGSARDHTDTRLWNHSGGETGIPQLNKPKCKDTHCTSVEEGMGLNKEHCDFKKRQHIKQVKDNSNLPQQQSVVQQKLNREHKDSRYPVESHTTDTEKAQKVLEEFIDNTTQKSSNSNSHQGTAYENYVMDPWKSGCMQLGKIILKQKKC